MNFTPVLPRDIVLYFLFTLFLNLHIYLAKNESKKKKKNLIESLVGSESSAQWIFAKQNWIVAGGGATSSKLVFSQIDRAG